MTIEYYGRLKRAEMVGNTVDQMNERVCNIEENKKECTCTYESCSRKGICCECIQHHLEKNELPACCFPPEVEKTYDRSFERFVQTYQN